MPGDQVLQHSGQLLGVVHVVVVDQLALGIDHLGLRESRQDIFGGTRLPRYLADHAGSGAAASHRPRSPRRSPSFRSGQLVNDATVRDITRVAMTFWEAWSSASWGQVWDVLCQADQGYMSRDRFAARFDATPKGQTSPPRPTKVVVVAVGDGAARVTGTHEERQFEDRTLELLNEHGRWRIRLGLGRTPEDWAYAEALRPLEFQLLAASTESETAWTAMGYERQTYRLERVLFLQPPNWLSGLVVSNPGHLEVIIALAAANPHFWIVERRLEADANRTMAVVYRGRVLATSTVAQAFGDDTLRFEVPLGATDDGRRSARPEIDVTDLQHVLEKNWTGPMA